MNIVNKNNPFKLKLKGSISINDLSNFISLDVRRIRQELHVESYKIIGPIKTRGGLKKKNSTQYKK